MAIPSISIDDFIKQRSGKAIFDVRSPGEYSRACIPGALSLPLFDDEERALVGTTYTKRGKQEAVELGLKFVGPKLARFVRLVRRDSQGRDVWVHCWRGGMRSSSMAWLLATAGFNVATLRGGYKSYRRLCQEYFSREWKIVILSGPTGSGKTEVLQHLRDLGEQVIDLEGLANHKGSAFGALGQAVQPSTEMFENLLFEQLYTCDPGRPIWLEDESVSIGTIFIPNSLFLQMTAAPSIVLNVPVDIRTERLVEAYGCFTPEELIGCINKLSKRLGGNSVSEAVSAVNAGDLNGAVGVTLKYYDKAYGYGLEKRNHAMVFRISQPCSDAKQNALLALEVLKSMKEAW
jgi:tRNA 2-selenouridine synthase